MFSKFLPHKVTIKMPTITKDDYGQDTISYSVTFDSTAFVISRRDKVFKKDIGIYELERIYVELPPTTAIDKDYVIEYDGKTYIVEGIEKLRDIKGRHVLTRTSVRVKD